MNNKALLFLIIILNIVMVFLLVHKQNKIIKASYDLQQLQEKKDTLLQKKKELTLAYQQSKQLSYVQTFAKESLKMAPIKLKDAHTLAPKEPDHVTIALTQSAQALVENKE